MPIDAHTMHRRTDAESAPYTDAEGFTFHLLRGMQAAADRETSYQLFKKYVEPGVTAAARAMQSVQQPGFGRIGNRRGLPCEACGAPTHWVDFEIDACSLCAHAETRPRKDGYMSATGRPASLREVMAVSSTWGCIERSRSSSTPV